jgi:hypothetical protein
VVVFEAPVYKMPEEIEINEMNAHITEIVIIQGKLRVAIDEIIAGNCSKNSSKTEVVISKMETII